MSETPCRVTWHHVLAQPASSHQKGKVDIAFFPELFFVCAKLPCLANFVTYCRAYHKSLKMKISLFGQLSHGTLKADIALFSRNAFVCAKYLICWLIPSNMVQIATSLQKEQPYKFVKSSRFDTNDLGKTYCIT